MKLLSKMVNFRTTPERYEQLKKVAAELPYPRTVANLINKSLAFYEEHLRVLAAGNTRAIQDLSECFGKKSTRPLRTSSKTRSGSRKRKT